MTLPVPVLDDRDFDQLLAELRGRIAVFTPEWTDQGPSDPGITLLELVAHLGETLLFRFNQIPDQTRLWLLRLLAVPPLPARRATGLVAFTAGRLAGPPPAVPLGTTVQADAVPFRVGNDVTVFPIAVTAVVKTEVDEPTDALLHDELRRLADANDLDLADVVTYEETVLGPDPTTLTDDQLLDVGPAVDRCLWIAVHAGPGTPGTTDEQRRALLDRSGPLARTPITLGIAGDAARPGLGDVAPCPGEIPPEPAPGAPDSSLIWEVTGVQGTDRVLFPVAVAADSTDGLRRSGVVALQLPAAHLSEIGLDPPPDPAAPVDPDEAADRAGVGRNAPPALADGPPVLFWLRAFPREGVPEIGRLRWVGANAADVEQVAQAPPELLGRGHGLSHQELGLANAPVVAESVQVQVQEDGTDWVDWTVVDSLAASSPDDRHLLLDAGAGRLRCGDSVRGRVLPAGAAVRALGYRHGGGRRGNVAAQALTQVADVGAVTVANPLPTGGGEDPEPIDRALERIPGELTRHDRAVVADDFRQLALVPGVGRAECLPRFDPRTRDRDAAGVVTVIVWPTEDPRHPDAPLADETLLRAVCARLDARRLVTTELFVVPATYHPVAVSVGIAVKPGYSTIGVRRWVELVLRQYLSPLPPFGPEGQGWPLGRRVHGPELEAAVLQVEGVEFVEALEVADMATGTPAPGPVLLAAWEVPELVEVTVVLGTPPAAGTGTPQPVPPTAPAPVPVPVPRSEC
ncbi:putative baseplate assembly protein [Pseudonocardia lacus]|uniref:putative baseplate assembly protein n=1 Tax=Pseudonocardia lacus TaxID=2835865 RepID=UPI001BDD6027|nr:putative baseplate assembly protein [Pseudonocardia lacus]